MKTLMTFLLMFPFICFAQSYDCKYSTANGSGTLDLLIKGKTANVSLVYEGKDFSYENCKAEKDDIGLLIDCNAGSLDFMVLLNNEVRPASGGIMSSTHELFADVDC